MAYSYNEVTATGSAQFIPVPPYIDQAHIFVSIDGVDTSSYSWVNSNTVSVAATASTTIRVYRKTSPGARVVDYIDGMSLTEVVLDNDSKQAFFLAQEQLDASQEAITAAVLAQAAAESAAASLAALAGFGGSAVGGNLAFTGSSQRIAGDFYNSTIPNRVLFQSSALNQSTSVGVVPNGIGPTTSFTLEDLNMLISGNSATASIALTAAQDLRFTSGIRGTGTYLPMTFYTGGNLAYTVAVDGKVVFEKDITTKGKFLSTGTTAELRYSDRTTTTDSWSWSSTGGVTKLKNTVGGIETDKLAFNDAGAFGLGGSAYGTAGQVLTSGGPGAVPTWTTPVLLNVQVFTSSGTYTPSANCKRILVDVLGPGAPGANAIAGYTAGGGKSLAYVYGSYGGAGTEGQRRRYFSNSPTTQTVTVGASGGTSSFGALCSAAQGTTGSGGWLVQIGWPSLDGRLGGGPFRANGAVQSGITHSPINGANGSPAPANSGCGGGGASTCNYTGGYAGIGGAGGSGQVVVYEYT